MNDFTKQELECLANAIDLQLKKIHMSQVNQDRREQLLNKLQLMVENYCEHKNTRTVCDADYVKVCNKCEELVSYE